MLSRPAAARVTTARETRAGRPGPQPDLRLETRVVSEPPMHGARAMSLLLPASLGLHATLVVTAIVIPLLTSEVLPPPASAAKVFFVEPSVIVPPPPPPARAAGPARIRPSPPTLHALTAPVETPEQIVPEAIDVGAPGGAPGGVEGGIPGGVVGGVVGGLPEPPAPIQPVRVGGGIREPTKLKHVDPVYPDIAVSASIHGNVVLECIVSPGGRVTDVKIIRGIPLLNAAAVEAVRQWVYTQTLKDGVPVPVILTVTVKFGLR